MSTRPVFLEPETLTPEAVADALALVGIDASHSPSMKSLWSDFELLLVYDWAVREHMHASGDPIRRRQQPYLVHIIKMTGALDKAVPSTLARPL